MAAVLAYLLVRRFEASLVVAWIATMAVIAVKHHRDLRQPPRLRERWRSQPP